MGVTLIRPAKGHRAKADRQFFAGDADDNATSVITITKPGVGHVIIDEIIAGYNGTVAANLVIAQNSVTLQSIALSGAAGVRTRVLLQEVAAYLANTFDVVITLDASGAGGTDGFVTVKWRYEGQEPTS